MLLILIEGAHVIWRRVQIREERKKTGARLRLKDVCAWRTVSILLGDTIAKAVVVIAVKHPPKTIYGIALLGTKPKFYLSFHITIENFLRVMYERFCAFNTLTMGERDKKTRRGEGRRGWK